MIPNRELLKVAFRNILRNRNRTILTVLAIVVGIFAFIMSNTVIGGIDETTIRNTLNAETAFIRIFGDDYYPDRRDHYLEDLMINDQALLSRIRSTDKNISVTPRLKFRGSVALPSEDMPCVIVGIDPENDGRVFNLLDSVRPTGDQAAETAVGIFRKGGKTCLVGYKLADLIGAMPGDEILLTGRTMRGAYNADSYVVSGLVSCDNPVIDAFSVVLPLDEAVRFADSDGMVSEISVRSGSREEKDIAPLLEAIKKELPAGLGAHPWYEEMADVLNVFKIRRAALLLIISMLLFIGVAGITNTMLIAVMERTREIGTLAAMGMKKNEITLLFLYEGVMIGLLGGFVALVLTLPPLLFVTKAGILMQGTDMQVNVPISSRLYGRLEWYLQPLAMLVAALTSAAASLYPASKAARMNIAETLRGKK